MGQIVPREVYMRAHTPGQQTVAEVLMAFDNEVSRQINFHRQNVEALEAGNREALKLLHGRFEMMMEKCRGHRDLAVRQAITKASA